MAAMKLFAAAILLAALLAAPAPAEAAIGSCSDVYTPLMPCISYVTGTAPLTTNCCSGITALRNEAATTADRQLACRCLKNMASGAGETYLSRAAGLPGACRTQLPYSISPNTDCNSIR